MKEIGGYFELELPVKDSVSMHTEGVCVNSGRHAFELILRSLDRSVKRVWLPYYTCDVMVEPIESLGLEYKYYEITKNLELLTLPVMRDGDYIVVNNYFGIKDKYVEELASIYADRIIIDNAQAWYAPELPGIKCFYSPRKYCGLPDGGIAFLQANVSVEMPADESYGRFMHLLKRIDVGASYGYADFKEASRQLSVCGIRKISNLTKRMLSVIDFDEIKKRRISNYDILSSYLSEHNLMELPDAREYECPMVYPFLCENEDMRKSLLDNKIYVATYWPNVKIVRDEGTIENYLCSHLLPLPIDQRYGVEEMHRIISIVKANL